MSSPIMSRVRARMRRSVLLVLVTGLALGAVLLQAPAAQAERYTPKEGVTFNYPLSKNVAARRAIVSKVLKSVGSSPKGSYIRFASWNIRGSSVVDALIAAHKRGVTVRVILDKKNAYSGNRNREVDRLQAELRRHGNRKRPAELKSGLRKCKASCRGKSGFAHSKFFVFSKAGKARQVVINSSSNATDLAAGNQWNDAYTIVGDSTMYDLFSTVFDQMYADQPVHQGYVTGRSGTTFAEFFPYTGDGTDQDPVLRDLASVRCTGATNTADGHTRIQISMTSWFGDRGIDIAKRIVALKRQGCRFKIVYAVAGNEVRQMLRRAHIPLRHIVQDFNRDGVYDRYLHQKVTTIRGVYGDDTSSWVTINGSSNWSPLSLISDEATLHISSKRVVKQYNRYIDGLYRNPPRNPASRGLDPKAVAAAKAAGTERTDPGATDDPTKDPAYAHVQVD